MLQSLSGFALYDLITVNFQTGYSTVRTKVLSLVASWNEVFKGEHRYNSVKEAYEALKTEGFQFPELNNSEDIFDAARVSVVYYLMCI